MFDDNIYNNEGMFMTSTHLSYTRLPWDSFL